VSQFVEECRREWKRLGVPDPVANEMAADLEADLQEAEAEGASAEEVLGSSAFDPQAFAASWAAERGVIQPAPVTGIRSRRRSRMPAAISVFALIAIIGAVLAIGASSSGRTRLALAPPFAAPGLRLEVPRWRLVTPAPPPTSAQVLAVDVNGSRADLRPIGLLLLVIVFVGIILSMLYWSPWANPRHWPRRHTSINEPPGYY